MVTSSPEKVRSRGNKDNNNSAAASKSPKSNSSTSTAKGRPPKGGGRKGKGQNEAKATRESSIKMVCYSLLFAILAIAGSIVLLKGVSLHEDYFASRLAAKEAATPGGDADGEPVVVEDATKADTIGDKPAAEEPVVEPPMIDENAVEEINVEEEPIVEETAEEVAEEPPLVEEAAEPEEVAEEVSEEANHSVKH